VCQICHGLPKNPIIYYQCTYGHLMCSNCYDNDNFTKKLCGLCRVEMKYPSRNRIAENELKNLLVTCQTDGCNATMKYSDITQHLKVECSAIQVECKYKKLGCNWKGLRRNINHQHRGIDYDELLAKMEQNDLEMKMLKADREADNLEARRFQNIIRNYNVYGIFEIKSIWESFNLENIRTSFVKRVCGDPVQNIRLELLFKIIENDITIDIFCRIYAIDNSHSLREIKATLVYAEGMNNDVFEVDETVIIKGKFNAYHFFESEYVQLICFDNDTIQEMNESIKKCKDSGDVKIFAWLN